MKNNSYIKLNNIELLFLYFMSRGYTKEIIAECTIFDTKQSDIIFRAVMKKLDALSPVQAVNNAKINGKFGKDRILP